MIRDQKVLVQSGGPQRLENMRIRTTKHEAGPREAEEAWAAGRARQATKHDSLQDRVTSKAAEA